MKTAIAGLTDDDLARPLRELAIDSFALVTLRVQLEEIAGREISDADWVSIKSLEDMIGLCDQMNAGKPKTDNEVSVGGRSLRRAYNLNMPQMAMGGLSESWLQREIGDVHWNMIVSSLGVPSSRLVDGNGDRLYATFTRISLEADEPLSAYREDEHVDIEGCLSRYGAGIFLSDMLLSGDRKAIHVKAMSSFTKRGSPNLNTDLMKGQPEIPMNYPVPVLDELPVFAQGYRDRRSEARGEPIFESSYDLVPCYDINGVGLLYFAAYPMISDICEQRYVSSGNTWPMRARVIRRDVCYFANCDINDTVLFRLHSFKEVDGMVDIETELVRSIDGTSMALINTRKVLTENG